MIYKANPYQRLYQLIESLWDQRLKHAHSIFALFPNYMVKSQGAHYQLLEALQKHDAEGTEKIMRQHKENVRQALIQYFEVSKRGQNHEPPTNEETASAA
jgi:DNA-binding GntR family transcriptional regulator